MKKRFLTLAVLGTVALASPMFGAIESQLILDDGAGSVATIDVNTGNIVTCMGACAGLLTISTGDHATLVVTGTLGQFNITSTGTGGAVSVDPTLQNLNELSIASTGAGTLTITYTDTDYTDFGASFLLGISGVQSVETSASLTSFSAFASGANAVPAGSLIGAFNNNTGLVFANSGVFANPVGASGSLTSVITTAFAAAGTIQANLTISNVVVPEPASVALFGTLLLVSGFAMRRKFGRATNN